MNQVISNDEFYMRTALLLARQAANRGEVPVGCVLVQHGRILSVATNEIVEQNHPLLHAEWLAIDRAQRRTGKLRLENTTLYTTLEPCAMCAGAILLARISRVVMGAMDDKRGCAGSVYQLLDDPAFNHKPELIRGLLGEECAGVLSEFFREIRAQKKKRRAASGPFLGY